MLQIKEEKRLDGSGYKGEWGRENIIVVMKSVRRNAELTSFTFYTSAVAHIINIGV